MPPPVERQMLPDLVGQGDRFRLHAGTGDQAQFLRVEHPRRGIVGIVEDDEPGPVGERLGQRRFRDPPARRRQPHQTRNAAGAQDQRQIGVIERLDQHHLVAG